MAHIADVLLHFFDECLLAWLVGVAARAALSVSRLHTRGVMDSGLYVRIWDVREHSFFHCLSLPIS